MTETAAAGAPRANARGNPCPLWCTADHAREIAPGIFWMTHESDPLIFPVTLPEDPTEPQVTIFKSGYQEEQQPGVKVRAGFGRVHVPADVAGDLAALLDAVAGMSAAEARDLADQVRAAAEMLEDGQ